MPATTADATIAAFFNAGGGATGLARAPEEMAKVGRKGPAKGSPGNGGEYSPPPTVTNRSRRGEERRSRVKTSLGVGKKKTSVGVPRDDLQQSGIWKSALAN